MKKWILIVFSVVFFFPACETDSHPKGWQPLDLLAHGVPVSVLAPPDAEVKRGKMKSRLFEDLSIMGGDDYQIQLFHSTAISNDIAKLKNDQLETVKTNRYFRKIVREEVAGFIYEMQMDSTSNYGFRFIKLQGDMEMTFQSGMNKLFDLEAVELMYEAVK